MVKCIKGEVFPLWRIKISIGAILASVIFLRMRGMYPYYTDYVVFQTKQRSLSIAKSFANYK